MHEPVQTSQRDHHALAVLTVEGRPAMWGADVPQTLPGSASGPSARGLCNPSHPRDPSSGNARRELRGYSFSFWLLLSGKGMKKV